MIRKFILFAFSATFISSLISPMTLAADTSGFQAGRIIDDIVFTNTSTMSVSAIQNFLNSKVPTCDTNHAGMTGGTGTVYNPKFICLKDFYENPSGAYTLSFPYTDTNGTAQTGTRTYYYNNAYTYTSLTPVYNNGDYRQGYQLRATVQSINGAIPSGAISAAQIIYNTAQAYGINPQVLIVLLQKEQGLVTDTWPAPYQYQSATGYGCPDYSPCSAGYAGFSNQVKWAATMFRAIMNNSSTWYTPYILGNNYIQYNPVASCGGTTVNIQNRSTQALYNYTPYQPNAAALAAGYGTGNGCSAYGNRNFYLYFTDWFGSTTGLPRDASIISTSNTSSWIEYGQSTTMSVTVKNTGNDTWCADGSCPAGQLPTRLFVQNYAPFPEYDPTDPAWVSNAQVKMQTPTVTPGNTGIFTFRVTAPYRSVSDSARMFVNIGGTGSATPVQNANVWIGVNSYAPPAPTLLSQSQSSNTQVLPGQEVAATVTIKNNSSTTWYSDSNLSAGRHPTRLITPSYVTSPYYNKRDPNWLTPAQIAMSTPTVAPGQTATFNFTLNGPLASSTAPLRLIPIIDGVSFLPDIGINLKVTTPTPILDYQYVSATSLPDQVTAGTSSTQNAIITLKNTGNTVWRSDSNVSTNPTRILTIFPRYGSSSFYTADGNWLSSAQIAMKTPIVNPGENATFEFAWKAPSSPGNYLQYFSLVTDGYGFFPQYGSAWRTIVTQ